MLQFIVLGYVPGTSVQFNFLDFVLASSALLLIAGLIWHVRHQAFKRRMQLLIATALAA